MEVEVSFKLILLGSPNVGKTSLIKRWMDGTFDEDGPKNWVDECEKTVVTDGGESISLSITDTAGQEKFRTLTSSYYRNTDAIVVTFDISEVDTFDLVPDWVEEVRRYATRAPIFIVGNKTDLDALGERRVKPEDGMAMAEKEERVVTYLETSAKDGSNVETLFRTVATHLSENCSVAHTQSHDRTGVLDLTPNPEDHKGRRRFC